MSFNKESKKYLEYRKGFFRAISEGIGKISLKDDDKIQKFVESLKNSNDINDIIYETSLCKKLDELDGVLKLILTVGSKWIEAQI